MSHIASVNISGVLTRDPELKFLPSGRELAELGIAVERSWSDDSGERQTQTSFFDIKVWGKFANVVNNKLRKADHVMVHGRLEQERWENEAGEKRSKVVIVANDIDASALYRKADGSDTPARQAGDNGQAQLPAAAAPASSAPAPGNGGPATSGNDGIPF